MFLFLHPLSDKYTHHVSESQAARPSELVANGADHPVEPEPAEAKGRLPTVDKREVSGSPPEEGGQGKELRIARIAAIAAICGALLGALGTGIPLLLTSDSQIVAAEKLSSEGFLREQRRAAYAELIQADQALQQVEQDCVSDIFEADGFVVLTPTTAEIAAIRSRLDVAYPAVAKAAANVQLIAPSETANLAGNLAKVQSATVAGMSQLTGNTYEAAEGKSYDDIRADLARSYAAYLAFVDAARRDLLPA